ncbi:MAG: glycine--tRNA ligase [Nocardioides sp.]
MSGTGSANPRVETDGAHVLTMQDALGRLADYWSALGCLALQPMNTEVGAGTMNPATLLRVLGPEPWRVAYVEPSVRPDDSRYGENPNRLQTHTQFQVILKPEPGNPQELYLGSLEALGIDLNAHDIRFVEDNWASPALGAWGLGWEVWLDGLEITQFTYFQQAGGVNLDPVSTEITYGVERILMALQQVTHFKDIAYAEGLSYGEIYGQSEYEMSRYYLDVADIAATRKMLTLCASEAQRMIDAGLPVPAYVHILKCSHAFNVLDARGAVSTAERASEFARMRRLTADVAGSWARSREELGHPLGVTPTFTGEPVTGGSDTTEQVTAAAEDEPSPVVFEIGTEELPPSEARAARRQLADALATRFAASRLPHGTIEVLATPRRVVAFIDDVAAREPDHIRMVKGPRASAAFDANGEPTRALQGFARSQGLAVEALERDTIAGNEYLVARIEETGKPALTILAEILSAAVNTLRPAKNMRWRDPGISFSRPIRWILALHGADIVPVTLSTLSASRFTRLHHASHGDQAAVPTAAEYRAVIESNGISLDPDKRRAEIVAAAQELAASVDGTVDVESESDLLDQITYLVEQPTPLLGSFAPSYLELPEAVLSSVMRKHQRYLPVRDAQGALLPHFVVIANGVIDPGTVRAGNEAVLRARYEDAAFFYRADQEVPLKEMRARLERLTFTDRLGSMLDRADRITALAGRIAQRLDLSADEIATLNQARQLVKADLGSQMVTEMTSLAGVMGREYALRAGEPADVALALYEAELPRQAADALPQSLPGAILALADRLDLLVGLAATTGLPTGSSDPFALRRAVLGLLAIYRAQPALSPLSLLTAFDLAAQDQPVEITSAVLAKIADFSFRRLEQQLIDEGQPVDRVRAVALHSDRPHRADLFLTALETLIERADLRNLAEALQRARRIALEANPHYDPAILLEPAEKALHEAVKQARANLNGSEDLEQFIAIVGNIVDPVNTFFDEIYVMADESALRSARLGLLATVGDLGSGVLTWDQLRL